MKRNTQTDTGGGQRGDSTRRSTANISGLTAGFKPSKPELKVGSPVCQCPTCDLFFTGPSIFDRHLLPDGDDVRCMTVAEMQANGMETNVNGVWQRGTSTGKGLGKKRTEDEPNQQDEGRDNWYDLMDLRAAR